MSIWLDGRFWNDYFERIFVAQSTNFCNAIINRVLPTFENAANESDEVIQAEYNRLGEMPTHEDGIDMGDIAEQAMIAGLNHFNSLYEVRQTIINVTVAALFHLFEQQLLVFHRRQVLHPSEENDKNKISIDTLKKRLVSSGVHIETLLSWSHIYELKLIANVVKHAEGRSLDELRQTRKDVFTPPESRQYGINTKLSEKRVYQPLAGHDIYLEVSDIEKYNNAIVAFWKEFGATIEKHSIENRK